MAYVTEDKRVAPIISDLRLGRITEAQAREAIGALPPDPGRAFAFLGWEVDEAVAEARRTRPRKGGSSPWAS